jgi:hypothetical protein
MVALTSLPLTGFSDASTCVDAAPDGALTNSTEVAPDAANPLESALRANQPKLDAIQCGKRIAHTTEVMCGPYPTTEVAVAW